MEVQAAPRKGISSNLRIFGEWKTYRYLSFQSVSSKRDVGKQVVGYYKPDRPDLITENRPRKPVFGGFLYFYGAAICLFFGIVTFTGM